MKDLKGKRVKIMRCGFSITDKTCGCVGMVGEIKNQTNSGRLHVFFLSAGGTGFYNTSDVVYLNGKKVTL